MTNHTATSGDLAAVDAAVVASVEATRAYGEGERAMYTALDLPHSNPRRAEAIHAWIAAREVESTAARALTVAEHAAGIY